MLRVLPMIYLFINCRCAPVVRETYDVGYDFYNPLANEGNRDETEIQESMNYPSHYSDIHLILHNQRYNERDFPPAEIYDYSNNYAVQYWQGHATAGDWQGENPPAIFSGEDPITIPALSESEAILDSAHPALDDSSVVKPLEIITREKRKNETNVHYNFNLDSGASEMGKSFGINVTGFMNNESDGSFDRSEIKNDISDLRQVTEIKMEGILVFNDSETIEVTNINSSGILHNSSLTDRNNASMLDPRMIVKGVGKQPGLTSFDVPVASMKRGSVLNDVDCDTCHDQSNTSENKDLDERFLLRDFLQTVDPKFRSLIFNPTAQSNEKFQSCLTPSNETGRCMYFQHCMLPNLLGTVENFMNHVCIIDNRFIGVCCADYPVDVVHVTWDEVASIPEVNNSAEETKDCGIGSKKRIVGGSTADPKAWPWMAALLSMTKGQFFCGGALINRFYVLTAAHCTFRIPRNQILVRLGEYDFSTKDEEFPGEDYPVVEIKRHGKYSRRTLLNDLALLKLGRMAEFGKNVSPICLPENRSYNGEMAVLAGWGNIKGGGPTSDVLLEANFPVVRNENCTREHGVSVQETHICTKSDDKRKGACNGDSGGPLMHIDDESKHWTAIGIVSWGRRGCDPMFPTVYTRVSSYLSWIKTHST